VTPQIAAVLAILGMAVVLFITERIRIDVIALIVLVSLAITGLVTPAEALSGFSNPAVITVWAILILSGGLYKTGVAGLLGHRLLGLAGSSQLRLIVILMLSAGLLSGFMNSIGVTSLFLPVVIDIARSTGQKPSKMLMPLAFAALLGGLLTLIGTPTNILVSEVLRQAGLRPFGMFDYTPVGLVVMISGIIFLALFGRRLLPDRDIARDSSGDVQADAAEMFGLQERMVIINIPQDSTLDSQTLAGSRLGSVLGINVIAIIRDGHTNLAPEPTTRLQSGDRLLIEGRLDQLNELHGHKHFVIEKEKLNVESLISAEIKLAEVEISSSSSLIGKTLRQVGFRYQFGVVVLAIRRANRLWRTNLETIPLQVGDTFLVQGKRDQLEALQRDAGLFFTKTQATEIYQLDERLMLVRIPDGSLLEGKSLTESRLGDAFGLGVMGIIRQGETHLIPSADERLMAGDSLLVKGRREDLLAVEGLQSLEIDTQSALEIEQLESEQISLMEAVLSPYSALAGKTLREIHFRAKYGLSVLAIWREGRAYRSNLRDMAIKFGDALLIYGPRSRLRMLGTEPDFLVLSEQVQEAPRLNKAPVAGLIMVAVLLPVILGWVNIAIAAVLGVVLMVLTGCLTMEEAYRSIDWKAIFLIAGMLPLGIAMQETGAAQFLAERMVSMIGGYGPLVIMAGLFLLAAMASQFMPNPAVAVLLAPVALNIANSLGISPYTLLMTVAVSASAAFLSPVGHPANVLIMGPGGYRFSDYIKVGLPLTLVVLVVVLLVLPLIWPFYS